MEDVTLETIEQEVVETVEEAKEVTEVVEQEFEQVEETASVEIVAELEKDEQLIVEEFNEAPASTEDVTEEVETVIETESVETEIEEVEEAEVTDFEAKFNELSAEFTALQTQLEELTSYKRQREESDVKVKFADKLSEEEFAQVFESMKDAEIQDVEDKLFALYGKKNFSITSTNTSTQANKVKLALPKDEDITFNPYGDIFDK